MSILTGLVFLKLNVSTTFYKASNDCILVTSKRAKAKLDLAKVPAVILMSESPGVSVIYTLMFLEPILTPSFSKNAVEAVFGKLFSLNVPLT